MIPHNRNIIIESTKLEKELSLPNVLIVSDDINDKQSKGLNRLISNRIITGLIVIKQSNINDLVELVKSNTSDNLFDYVVFKSSGLYDTNSKFIIQSISILNSVCKSINSELIVVNFSKYPYINRSIKKYKDFNSKYLVQSNRWIDQSDLNVIDIEFLDQDNDYFNNNGDGFNPAGRDFIYDQLEIIFNINASDESSLDQEDTKIDSSLYPGDVNFNVYVVQKKLKKLGYDIDSKELIRNQYGKSTLAAITAFKIQNNLADTDAIDVDTLVALKQAKIKMDTGKSIQKSTEKIPVDIPPAVYNDDIVRDANFRSSIEDQATRLLVRLEGFTPTPGWDEKNWRIGYGSSTITKADGEIIKLSNDPSVRPLYIITREDAARDLARRMRDEFIPDKVISKIGSGNSLPNGVIAALVSIAYNYGSLPASIKSAAQEKDIQKIADAIRARQSDNAGRNRNRRNKEANYVLAASNINEIKQQRTILKIFDHTNPKHIAILKEELIKAKQLLREYNENEIWNSLSINQREELLLMIDDDLGPDLANVYAEEDWKDIPEVIQSRIDLSSTPDAEKLKEPEKDAKMYFRGIVNMLKDEEKQYSNVPDVLKFLKTKLNVLSADYETIIRALYNYLQTKTTAELMRLNVEVQEMLKRKTPYVDSKDSTSFDAWMQQLMKSGEKLGD